MNGFLLDTDAFLILSLQDETVTGSTRALLEAAPRYVSQICAVELAMKHSIGKLLLPEPYVIAFASAFERTVSEFQADVLPLALRHIQILSRLPLLHRDPFDRMIISQAIAEGLTVVTRDSAFVGYDSLSVLEI